MAVVSAEKSQSSPTYLHLSSFSLDMAFGSLPYSPYYPDAAGRVSYDRAGCAESIVAHVQTMAPDCLRERFGSRISLRAEGELTINHRLIILARVVDWRGTQPVPGVTHFLLFLYSHLPDWQKRELLIRLLSKNRPGDWRRERIECLEEECRRLKLKFPY